MTKLISFTSILIFMFCRAQAQDSILFQMHYLPQHVYTQTGSQDFNIILTYSGSDSAMDAMKEKGIENPVYTDRKINMKSIITTGILNSENKMPVELEFVSAKDKEGNSIIPAGTKMLGMIEKNKMPVYDSIVSDSINESDKQKLLNTLQNILSQINLPNKKMTTGDKYTIATPVTIPLGSLSFKMIFSTTYQLVNLNDSLAIFKTDLKYTIDMNSGLMDASGGGEGGGKIIVDRRNEYPLKYETNYLMNLKAIKNSLSLEALLKETSVIEYNIRKNNTIH